MNKSPKKKPTSMTSSTQWKTWYIIPSSPTKTMSTNRSAPAWRKNRGGGSDEHEKKQKKNWPNESSTTNNSTQWKNPLSRSSSPAKNKLKHDTDQHRHDEISATASRTPHRGEIASKSLSHSTSRTPYLSLSLSLYACVGKNEKNQDKSGPHKRTKKPGTSSEIWTVQVGPTQGQKYQETKSLNHVHHKKKPIKEAQDKKIYKSHSTNLKQMNGPKLER